MRRRAQEGNDGASEPFFFDMPPGDDKQSIAACKASLEACWERTVLASSARVRHTGARARLSVRISSWTSMEHWSGIDAIAEEAPVLYTHTHACACCACVALLAGASDPLEEGAGQGGGE